MPLNFIMYNLSLPAACWVGVGGREEAGYGLESLILPIKDILVFSGLKQSLWNK